MQHIQKEKKYLRLLLCLLLFFPLKVVSDYSKSHEVMSKIILLIFATSIIGDFKHPSLKWFLKLNKHKKPIMCIQDKNPLEILISKKPKA